MSTPGAGVGVVSTVKEKGRNEEVFNIRWANEFRVPPR